MQSLALLLSLGAASDDTLYGSEPYVHPHEKLGYVAAQEVMSRELEVAGKANGARSLQSGTIICGAVDEQ
jgi:hypothetical protein